MARKITARVESTWVYLDDNNNVQELPHGQLPKEGSGSHFEIGPTPYDLILEGSLSSRGYEGSRPFSVVMADAMRASVIGWTEVYHPVTGKEIDFADGSMNILPADVQDKLTSWIFARLRKQDEDSATKKGSAGTRTRRRSSGRATKARGTAGNARG